MVRGSVRNSTMSSQKKAKSTKRETTNSVRFSRIPSTSKSKNTSNIPTPVRNRNLDPGQVNKVLQFSPVATPGKGSASGMKEPSAKDPIKVFLRIRPLTPDEVDKGETMTVSRAEEQKAVVHTPLDSQAFRLYGESESAFSFHKVWDQETKQEQVFGDTAKGLIDEVFAGRNGIIFAYGITKSGKTHTILGNNKAPGIMPRALEYIFSRVRDDSSKDKVEMSLSKENCNPAFTEPLMDEFEASTFHEFKVSCSYVEVYNEQVYDLLAEPETKTKSKDLGKTNKRTCLQLKENAQGAVFVKGLNKVELSDAEHGGDVLQQGQTHRQIAETNANRDSSRSHTIFTVTITRTSYDKQQAILAPEDRIPSRIRNTKLMIIDLAGSERPGRTRAQGERLREAAIINTSLMTLGRCFEALRWNQTHSKAAQKVVPYRDSKLTRMFNDPLNNGRAVMIVNVDPCASNFEETLHTLKYAALAREIQTVSRIDHGQKIVVPQQIPVTPGGSKKRLSDIAVEELERLETRESVGSSVMGYDELLEMYETVAQKLIDTEAQMANMEMAIREETAKEMAETLAEQADHFQSLLDHQQVANEENYNAKIESWNQKRADQERESERQAYIAELERQVAADSKEHEDLRQHHVAQLAYINKHGELLAQENEQLREEMALISAKATEAAVLAEQALLDKTEAWEGLLAQTEAEHQKAILAEQEQRDCALSECDSLRSELTAAQEQISKLQDMTVQLESKIAALGVEHLQVQDRLQGEHQEALKEAEGAWSQQEQQYQQQVAELEEKITSLQQDITEGKQELAQATQGFAEERERLQSQVAAAEERIQAVQAELTETQEQFQQDLAAAETKFNEDKDTAITQVVADKDASIDALSSKHNTALTALKTKLKAAKKESKDTLTQVKETQAQLKKAHEDIDTLQGQVDSLSTQITSMESEMTEEKVAMQLEIDNAQQENADLLAKLDSEIERCADIKDEVFKIKLESNEKSQVISDLEKQIAVYQDQDMAVQHLQSQVSTMVPREVHEQKVQEAIQSSKKTGRRRSKRKSQEMSPEPETQVPKSKRGRFNIQTGDKRMGVETIDVETVMQSDDEEEEEEEVSKDQEQTSGSGSGSTSGNTRVYADAITPTPAKRVTRSQIRKGLNVRQINVSSGGMSTSATTPLGSPAKPAKARLTRGVARLFRSNKHGAQGSSSPVVTRSPGFAVL